MANKYDIDEFLRHEIYLQRFGKGAINSVVVPGIEATYKAVRAILFAKGVPATQKQMDAIEAAVIKAILSNSPWIDLTAELESAAIYEAEWTQKKVGAEIGAVAIADKRVLAYVNQQMLTLRSGNRVDAGFWESFIAASDDANIDRVNGIIRSAYADGWTYRQTEQELKRLFEGDIRRYAETLTRTGMAHYTNQARAAWAESNADLNLEAHLVFTFDNRISETCKFLSTQKTVFKLDDPKRRIPPFHPNCRTIEVFLPAGSELVGTRSSVGGQQGETAKEGFEAREARTDKKVKYRGKRDAEVFKPGQVKASTGYESWLRSQPAWFIDDSLGKSRGKLFREGQPLSSFYGMTGRPLTLDELRGKE